MSDERFARGRLWRCEDLEIGRCYQMSLPKEKRWREFCGNDPFHRRKQDLTRTTLTTAFTK